MLPETVVVVKVGWVPEGETEGTEGKGETGDASGEANEEVRESKGGRWRVSAQEVEAVKSHDQVARLVLFTYASCI